MGGRGVGTNPEELLVSALASCYSATLYAVLQRAHLPVDSLKVAARCTLHDYPKRARFAGLVVSPTILGGDPRQREAGLAELQPDLMIKDENVSPGLDGSREWTLAWRSGE